MEEPTAYQSSQVNPQFPEEEQLNCPRCNSANTKFCYYNNYNLSQPRHICKSCKRYWTKGGTLRNIPVGGVTRKKRSSNPKRTISTQYQSKPEQLTSALVQGTGFSFTSPKLMVKLNTTCSSTDAPAENPISSSESNMIRMEFGSRENTVEDSSCCEDGNRWLDLSFSTPGSVDKVVNYL